MAIKALNARLSDLHAERVRTWPAEKLQGNIDVRRGLVETADWTTFVKVGDLVPDVLVNEVDGEALRLSALLRHGPVAFVFFRFAGCPACNIALPYYQEALWPGLRQRGVQLVALSPQIPERLVEIKCRHSLDFLVANDVDNALARSFGITFQPDALAQAEILAKGGAPISDTTGASTWELPMPAVIVIDQERRVRFVDVSPDWLVRTEAEPVLVAVDALTPATADA